MATLSRSDLSAVLNLVFGAGLVDQFRRDIVLLNLLRVVPGRNDTCTWRAKFDGRSAGGAYSEGSDMADGDFDAHTRLQASLNWAQYRKGAKISGLAAAVHAATGGTGMDMSLFDEELVDAIDELALDIGSDCYGGDPGASPTELAGAAIAVDSSTASSFAGINPATYGDWVGNENSLAEADLSIAALRTNLHRPIKDATGMDPEFVTCPGDLFDKVKELVDEKKDAVTEIRTAARGVVDIHAAAGAKAVSVDGVPYIEDRHCTASTFYGWHSRFVEVRQLPAAMPEAAQVVRALKALSGVDVPVDEIQARLQAIREGGFLVPTIEMLAQTGDAYKAQVKAYVQTAWKRRNAHGKLTIT